MFDLMQLTDVVSLVRFVSSQDDIEILKQLDIIDSITLNPKFTSLFRGSLHHEKL